MSASDYLPLLAGLAAPLVVLVLLWATGRALESARKRKMDRRASRGTSRGRSVLLKRPVAVFGAASAALIAAAVGVMLGQQGGLAQTVGDSGATLPTSPVGEPPAGARPEPREPESQRRRPKRVAVSVINAAGVQGLAARTSTRLRRKGFRVTVTGSSRSRREESVVWYEKGKEPDARRARRALRIASHERNDRQVRAWARRAGIVVFLGADAADSPLRRASTGPSKAPYTTR